MAEDEGIPIYVISTNDVSKDPISSNVFRRLSTQTGGKAYWAKTWQKQVEAFEAIREDLGNSYTVTYYPAPNQNEGFRKIDIQIVSDVGKHYRVRSRPVIVRDRIRFARFSQTRGATQLRERRRAAGRKPAAIWWTPVNDRLLCGAAGGLPPL